MCLKTFIPKWCWKISIRIHIRRFNSIGLNLKMNKAKEIFSLYWSIPDDWVIKCLFVRVNKSITLKYITRHERARNRLPVVLNAAFSFCLFVLLKYWFSKWTNDDHSTIWFNSKEFINNLRSKKTNPINVLLVQSLEKKKQKKILFIFLFTMITKQYSSVSFISSAH